MSSNFSWVRPDRVEPPRRRVRIILTDVDQNLSIGADSQYGQITIDLSTTTSSIVTYPALNEVWYVTKVSETWVLDRRASFQFAALLHTAKAGDQVWTNSSGSLIIGAGEAIVDGTHIHTAPNGTKWKTVVSNTGVVTAIAIP